MSNYLHRVRLCICSPDCPFSLKSTFTLSIHLIFLSFPPHPSSPLLCPTYSSSLLMTWPYRFKIFSCVFLDTLFLPLWFCHSLFCNFLPRNFIFVAPHIHLNILISTTSIFSCTFVSAHPCVGPSLLVIKQSGVFF